ncbi:hypothetical protein K2173_016381 [Erythroxylum novogranatense]|uniref:Uncharacterized protein n=1 Tax=Erythroxylum novogranatense TaxID=1862640 RepID=A0AAV8SGY5_9ROSI|nr:hypothetical protein K2173_016381 [Erythroxylum novogranatense]
MQRNLVYVIGLPLDLADEANLWFVPASSTKRILLTIWESYEGIHLLNINWAIQTSSNNSYCLYITYSKEEEVVCCIQSVHSFVLEGKSLRACFGATKYCHAWLKNMPCGISDCLYLHDFGSVEDSFTKDDLVSAFTR